MGFRPAWVPQSRGPFGKEKAGILRKLASVVGVGVLILFVLCVAVPAQAQTCATIQGGSIFDSKGNPVAVGYDQWGYNYQAHMFNGLYGNYSRPSVIVTDGDDLEMKWNDAWLSNQDCDGDQVLDRYYGFTSYIGSGAWLTNHQKGVYIAPDPKTGKDKSFHWTYFVKIVAAPSDAVLNGGLWYAADGSEIGPAIWGAFAVVEELYNDAHAGQQARLRYHSPFSSGFGVYAPK